MNKAEPPHLPMRGSFLEHDFFLRAGPCGVIRIAALATGQGFALLFGASGDECGDFRIDLVATVTEVS